MPEFKKLTRFVIQCSVCGRKTDCLAVDMAAASTKFAEGGWRSYGSDKAAADDQPDAKQIICNRCTRRFSYLSKRIKGEK